MQLTFKKKTEVFKTRPFSSTNKKQKNIRFPLYYTNNKEKEPEYNSNFNILNEKGQKEYMNFRSIGYRLNYTHKVFNKYWQPDHIYNQIRKNPEENCVFPTKKIKDTEENKLENKDNTDDNNCYNNNDKKLEINISDPYDKANKRSKSKGDVLENIGIINVLNRENEKNNNENLPNIKNKRTKTNLNTYVSDNKDVKSFITMVGGKDINLSRCLTNNSTRPQSVMTTTNSNLSFKKTKIFRPFTAKNFNLLRNLPSAFRKGQPNINDINNTNNDNVSKITNGNNLSNAKKMRPTTAKVGGSRFNNNNNNTGFSNIPTEVLQKFDEELKEEYEYNNSIFKEDEELFDDFEQQNKDYIQKYMDQFPDVKKLLEGYEKLNIIGHSVKKSKSNNVILELFDRSQSTRAATLDRVGSCEYKSPCQRIGTFINFTAHLQYEDIQKIGRVIYANQRNLTGYQSKHNIQVPNFGPYLNNYCLHFRDPNSLFHGYMPYEEEGQQMISPINKLNNIYDPLDFLPKYVCDSVYNEKLASTEFKKSVKTSMKNYNKYLVSDKINDNDLKKLNIVALKRRVIKKLNVFLLPNLNVELINDALCEVREDYIFTLKKIILNYILLSPFERKRLNIVNLPRKILPASFTIAQHGSFNNKTYKNWVGNYNNAFVFLEKNLGLCNIGISALIDWSHSFKTIDLIYLKQIDTLKDENGYIHIDKFCQIQEAYINKIYHFMRDVYYRGCLLIAQKSKFFKRSDVPVNGRWTFKGFIPYSLNDSPLYGLSFEDQLLDFWTNISFPDLVDIRLSPSNVGFLTFVKRKKILLEKPDYTSMSVEEKIKFNNSMTAYITKFYRKLIENSLNELCNFFEKYPSNSEILARLKKNGQKSFLTEIIYEDKDIKLPELNAFILSAEVEPLISIKVVYEDLYNLIKLEYTFDQVFEKIAKIIDQLCELFNKLPTMHFMEFKTILPSERERTLKEHSTKLNDFFNVDPNKNKSFLEEYYTHLCPNMIMTEIDTGKLTKKTLLIMKTNEQYVNDVKSKIYRQMKAHYIDLEEALKVFEPLKELITKTLDDQITQFISASPETPDYLSYMKFLEKIIKFRDYITRIPNSILYSMFSVDNRSVKADLLGRLNNNLRKLFGRLEKNILNKYEKCEEKFGFVIKQIDKKLYTPMDIVDMEKIKAKMGQEIILINNNFEDSFKIFLFLIKENCIYPDETINRVCETYKKYLKFKEENKRIEQMHAENRETIEAQFRKERAELEHNIEIYRNELDLMDKQTHINEYTKVLATLSYLKDRCNTLEESLNKSVKDEELLFDYKNEGFGEFILAQRKLEKLIILWENIQTFYEERKTLMHNFSEEIDLNYYIEIFKDIEFKIKDNIKSLLKGEEVIGKMSKIVGDDIENINEFLYIVQKVIESPTPLNENLKNELLEALENKRIEQSCREILFMYYNKKG